MVEKIEIIKNEINKYLSKKENVEEEWIEDNHPIDIAEALSELDASQINNFTKLLETEDLADIFEESEKELQIDILKWKSSEEIIEIFSNLEFEVEKLADFNQSMVTKGGIDLKEINPQTMESKIITGLFAAGEVLDIDGNTGGYNLQAAFSTAYLAGQELKSRI